MRYTPITLTTSFFVGYTGSDPVLCIQFHQRRETGSSPGSLAIEHAHHCILSWGAHRTYEGKLFSPQKEVKETEKVWSKLQKAWQSVQIR